MRRRRTDVVLAGVLVAVSYVPLLLSNPGMVAADTKQYLYLDPGRLTEGAASMWDPAVGLGTVTHQNIGYLFPMGPYYTAVQWLGVPTWIGQRVWMGSLLLAAGLGAAYCARRLGLEGPGRAVAAIAYMLTPYVIDYLGRTSAILMPWAALGWMVGLTVVAARGGGWRRPAMFAVVVALVGGVNATSILLVGLAPALWLVYAVFGTREVSGRRAAAAAARIGSLSVLVSLWWAAGLWAEGRYGIDVLRVTETVPTVASTSSAAEVLRGLGYWYFYGWDKVQPWTLPAVPYTQSLWLVALSLTVPAVAVALGLVSRWRYRAFAMGLVGLGTLVAVGAFPYGDPSVFGSLLKGASAGSTVALAMRSVDRVVPVVVLGLSLLMGAGVSAIRLRWSRTGLVAAAACLALVAADLPPLWTGDLIASNLDRPSSIPAYWDQAAAYLDSQGAASRVLGLPGEDFAAYSWGVTQDPVAPGLLDRPYVSRQVVPAGTPPAANLVEALDEPLQEGTLDVSALAPIARLMSVGQVVLQSDLQYERYHLPLPKVLWTSMVPAPAGLEGPVTFGPPDPAKQIRYPLNSEARLGVPPGTPEPPALAVFDVPSPRPLVRSEPAGEPMVVAGDGSGLVEAASAGLLGGDQLIEYGASLAQDPAGFARAMQAGATLVLTDTDALRSERWGSLRDNFGQVAQPGVTPLGTDPSDYSLPVFPGQSTESQTVAEVSGVASVRASSYGDPLTFTPEDRPINALDGNPQTAWTCCAHSPVAGAEIQVDLDHPVTVDHVTLLQVRLRNPDRRVASATLRFDGGEPLHVSLGPASYKPPGQVVSFPARTFSQLELTVDSATAGGADKRFDGTAQVGFAEIGIPGVGPVHEVLRMPTALLAQAGTASLQHPLDILMQRLRVAGPPRHDPELQIRRVFSLPTARTFTVGGEAEINPGDSDYLINDMIGLTPAGPLPPPPLAGAGEAVVVAANSSTRLDGDLRARANAAVDGDPSTSWIAETGKQDGEWVSYDLSHPITFDHLDLQVVNDGRHSLPTRLTIATGSGSRTVGVPAPPVGTGRPLGATSAVPLSFPALTGSRVRVTVDSVRQVRSLDYYSLFAKRTDILPVGIAELGLPVSEPPVPARLPTTCQTGLLRVDGKSVDVRVIGTTADALAGKPLTVSGCGNSAGGVTLGPGKHLVETSPRLPSGWSIDLLSLESPAGGGGAGSGLAVPGTGLVGSGAPGSGEPVAAGVSATAATPASSDVRVDHHDRTSWTVTVDGDGRALWLVLGQSFSKGWSATLAGGRGLGPPQLVDGYANGWYVPAGELTGPTVVRFFWTPQRVVWGALALSAASLLGVFLVAVVPERWYGRRRRRRRRALVPAARPGPYPISWSTVMGRTGSRPGWVVVLAGSVVWAAVVAFASRPLTGVVAGALVGAGCWWPRGRLAVRAAALAALASLPVYVTAQQAMHSYWPDINWPAELSLANDLAWLGVALLGADVVVGVLRDRAGARRYARGGKDARS